MSGAVVSLSGAGFQPDEPISIYWDWQNASHPGTLMASTFADETGAFISAGFSATGAPGPHVVAGVGQLSQAPFWLTYTVLPALTLTPFLGAIGQSICVTGTGYASGTVINATGHLSRRAGA